MSCIIPYFRGQSYPASCALYQGQSKILHCTELYRTSSHCTSSKCTALHCPTLHSTALNCAVVPHGTTIHSTTVHRTALYPENLHLMTRRNFIRTLLVSQRDTIPQHFTLHTVLTPLYSAHYTHNTLLCTLHTLLYTLHPHHFTLHITHSTLNITHTVLCTPQGGHFKLYTAHLHTTDFTSGHYTRL